ncbi:MAG: GNAT family N-acetyltransferase [Candidatus Latescibacterota bacterium]|nr:MAG: GNAT family N-acetyltransferase [Candidatus Latescibacterota bacterium]
MTRKRDTQTQMPPTKDFEIRHATKDDVPAIVALYNLSKLEGDVIFDVKIVGNIFERLQKHPNFHYYVSVADDRVVGTFMLLVMEKSARRDTPEGIVENITVHPKFQRQGIGKRMMRFAIEKCKEEGCSKLIFSTTDRNVRELRFFETLGFKRHGYGYVLDLNL